MKIWVSYSGTFLVSWQAEEAVPAWHQDHIIPQVLALYLCFLKDDNIRFENVEHCLLGHQH